MYSVSDKLILAGKLQIKEIAENEARKKIQALTGLEPVPPRY